MCNDGRLLAGCCGRLRIRHVSGLAEAEDVLVFLVMQRIGGHIHPAGCIRERACSHKVWGGLWQRHMNHVEVGFHQLFDAVGQRPLKSGTPARTVDPLEYMTKAQVNAVGREVVGAKSNR